MGVAVTPGSRRIVMSRCSVIRGSQTRKRCSAIIAVMRSLDNTASFWNSCKSGEICEDESCRNPSDRLLPEGRE